MGPANHQQTLKRLVRGYLRGVEDSTFVELVGRSLMADNFAIFNAILTLLPSAGLAEDQRFCLETQLRLWEVSATTRAVPAAPGHFSS